MYAQGALLISYFPLNSLDSIVNGVSSTMNSSPDHDFAKSRCLPIEAGFTLNVFSHLFKEYQDQSLTLGPPDLNSATPELLLANFCLIT